MRCGRIQANDGLNACTLSGLPRRPNWRPSASRAKGEPPGKTKSAITRKSPRETSDAQTCEQKPADLDKVAREPGAGECGNEGGSEVNGRWSRERQPESSRACVCPAQLPR